MPNAHIVAKHFKIEEQVGYGDAGTVYRARDLRSGEVVALKVVERLWGDGDEALFSREASAFAGIRHPHVVRYLDHGPALMEGNSLALEMYLAMEWLDGGTLRDRLERHKITPREAMDLGARVADALAAIHAGGLVHRNIKPRSLFLPGGELAAVKVLDLGVIRTGGRAGSVLRPLDKLDVGYMAPEVATGKDTADARSDVFSLGAVIFRCVAGRPAFTGKESWDVMDQIVSRDTAPLLSDACPGAPRGLSDLVARMLAKKKADRPADGAEVARALRAI